MRGKTCGIGRLGNSPSKSRGILIESPRRLEFCFTLNQAVADARGAVTLRARINDRDLEARIFKGAGERVYSVTIPVDMWDGLPEDNLRIDFILDRGYHPPPPDRRELGLQVIFEKVGLTHRREFTYPIRLR
jgi:hypothetical protein